MRLDEVLTKGKIGDTVWQVHEIIRIDDSNISEEKFDFYLSEVKPDLPEKDKSVMFRGVDKFRITKYDPKSFDYEKDGKMLISCYLIKNSN